VSGYPGLVPGLRIGEGGAVQGAALLRAAHRGPTLAVTAVAALLALSARLDGPTVAVAVLAVLTGQLVIGWSNDLIDLGRDVHVGRSDKPLVAGDVRVSTVRGALALAGAATVALSLALGPPAGLTHLVLVVGGGLAYNAALKATPWSWLPYAMAFGALPAVLTLAETPPVLPSWEVPAAGALLGVGAHFVNVLPDLADDAATGVRGLPHRLGARRSQHAATGALVLASAVIVLAPGGAPGAAGRLALSVSAVLAVAALRGKGRTPFRAAIGIALVNVALLTVLGPGTP
jgi:4-hydroxybenzoate polyprenyltransferase